MMHDIFDALAFIAGFALVGAGTWWLSPAWSLVTMGILLVGLVVYNKRGAK